MIQRRELSNDEASRSNEVRDDPTMRREHRGRKRALFVTTVEWT